MSILERGVKRNRTIISANLGREWTKYEDPKEIEEFFIDKCDHAGKLFSMYVERLTHARHGFGFRHYRTEVFDSARLEEFETSQLEVAFIYGNRDVIDKITRGSRP
jgi:hypothetical protein